MNKFIINNVSETTSALFILLFTYTAISKLTNRAEFESILWQNTFINHRASFVSWAVPVSELMIVILLSLPWTNKLGLLAATMMMVVFTIYIILMKMLLPVMPCYCGGFIKKMTWNQHIVFNIGFITLGILAIRRSYEHNKLNNQ